MYQLMSVLPHLNACLNSLSGIFLLVGFYFIRNKKIESHRKCMLTSFIASAVFLASYLTYHSLRAYYFHIGPSRFTGEGWIRPVYFSVLITHTILAVVIAPFILVTLSRALKGRFFVHAKLARWTFPVWLYVSITGVFVYVMLYQVYAAP
jgi:putative membrane protein